MTEHRAPSTREHFSTHIPALRTLMLMGWHYRTATSCLEARGSLRDVMLKDELIAYLQSYRYEFEGTEHSLTPAGIEYVVGRLKPSMNEGLLTANRVFTERLTQGVTVDEFINGKKHSVTVRVIDFENTRRNRFTVTDEFEVMNTGGTRTRRPDIVGFVNGLPLVVIEAKVPASGSGAKDMLAEGISQTLRNQGVEEIPHLFAYSQLLFSISGIDSRYATTRTPAKFWARWREQEFEEAEFLRLKNLPLSSEQATALLTPLPQRARRELEAKWSGEMAPTDQDRTLVGLLRPDRFLEFVRYFILFDRKIGKIAARYPQVFGVKALMNQIRKKRTDGGREGGVIWHTTGSGKSYAMVLLCRALLLHPDLANCRVVVVLDRKDLQKQLSETFQTGGAFGSAVADKHAERSKATSGRDLAKRIGQGNERILFTIIDKFNNASRQKECFNDSPDMIVLVDEGHRSHGGENHERMRNVLPKAAFVAFTGTPLLKDDKTTNKFGPIISAYTMADAVDDGAVTPLLYEDRKPKLDVNDKAIDNWFDRLTTRLSEEQRADLKSKYAKKGVIYGSKSRIELLAWDIADHFSNHVKAISPALKGQVATDSKLSAVRYQHYLNETGMVSAQVVISAPDEREGHEEVDSTSIAPVQQWWKDNVGSEDPDVWEKRVIEDFGTDGPPDLLIVVDKLLTGFDEPRNTVLYIDKPLKQHNLIQAIARVNRLHEHKSYGLLIDYRGILEELDTSIKDYEELAERNLAGYDREDIEGLYANVSTQYKQLPRLHDLLWEIFADVKNKSDNEQFRQHLMPKFVDDEDGVSFDERQSLREDFYAALRDFGMCLKVALSTRAFFEDRSFSEDDIRRYKDDLKFFTQLRAIAKRDAQETVDYGAYEDQIRRLVDKHVVGSSVEESDGAWIVGEYGSQPEEWPEEKTRNEADVIKTRVKKTIEQKLNDDPYAQKVFSEMLKAIIEEAEALFDYPLKQYRLFRRFEQRVKERDVGGTPEKIADNQAAQAYFGVFRLILDDMKTSDAEAYADRALQIEAIVDQAVAEHSLNPTDMENTIRKNLLVLLHKVTGMDAAKKIAEQVIRIVRVGPHKAGQQ